MSGELITIYFDDIVIDEDKYDAVLFDLGLDGNIWIPRSLINNQDLSSLDVPEWFALKEELI